MIRTKRAIRRANAATRMISEYLATLQHGGTPSVSLCSAVRSVLIVHPLLFGQIELGPCRVALPAPANSNRHLY